jgi:hypothetical protein
MRIFCLAAACLLSFGALAADNYTSGSYYTVTGVDTQPGHFDDYIGDLKANYRRSLDMMKADGKIKGYTMFANVHARHDEPDLYLLVEWNTAGDMLDTPDKYFDELTAKLFGSEDAAQEAGFKRDEIRTIKSTSLLRELSFTK